MPRGTSIQCTSHTKAVSWYGSPPVAHFIWIFMMRNDRAIDWCDGESDLMLAWHVLLGGRVWSVMLEEQSVGEQLKRAASTPSQFSQML